MGSLEELRVLDLTDRAAGAFATKLFADYGADVIAVEPPSGNPLRRHGPFAGDWPRPITARSGIPRHQQALDHPRPPHRDRRRPLPPHGRAGQPRHRDFPPGTMATLGLGFTHLQAIKRRLVLTSITPYGQDGPRADWRATNLTSFASGGQMSLTGEPDREPLVNGGYQAEYQAGLNAFAATVTAAQYADSYEIPQHVDISMQECMAASLELYLPWVAYLDNDISQRKGNLLSALDRRLPGEGRLRRHPHHPPQLALLHPGHRPPRAHRRPPLPRRPLRASPTTTSSRRSSTPGPAATPPKTSTTGRRRARPRLLRRTPWPTSSPPRSSKRATTSDHRRGRGRGDHARPPVPHVRHRVVRCPGPAPGPAQRRVLRRRDRPPCPPTSPRCGPQVSYDGRRSPPASASAPTSPADHDDVWRLHREGVAPGPAPTTSPKSPPTRPTSPPSRTPTSATAPSGSSKPRTRAHRHGRRPAHRPRTPPACAACASPTWRNHGVGQALLDHAIAFCRDRGYTKLILDTTEQQATASASTSATASAAPASARWPLPGLRLRTGARMKPAALPIPHIHTSARHVCMPACLHVCPPGLSVCRFVGLSWFVGLS